MVTTSSAPRDVFCSSPQCANQMATRGPPMRFHVVVYPRRIHFDEGRDVYFPSLCHPISRRHVYCIRDKLCPSQGILVSSSCSRRLTFRYGSNVLLDGPDEFQHYINSQQANKWSQHCSPAQASKAICYSLQPYKSHQQIDF